MTRAERPTRSPRSGGAGSSLAPAVQRRQKAARPACFCCSGATDALHSPQRPGSPATRRAAAAAQPTRSPSSGGAGGSLAPTALQRGGGDRWRDPHVLLAPAAWAAPSLSSAQTARQGQRRQRPARSSRSNGAGGSLGPAAARQQRRHDRCASFAPAARRRGSGATDALSLFRRRATRWAETQRGGEAASSSSWQQIAHCRLSAVCGRRVRRNAVQQKASVGGGEPRSNRRTHHCARGFSFVSQVSFIVAASLACRVLEGKLLRLSLPCSVSKLCWNSIKLYIV